MRISSPDWDESGGSAAGSGGGGRDQPWTASRMVLSGFLLFDCGRGDGR